ncbi:hypothetical protein C2S52_015873 [Perilla frutescens var. hirtella]|nr:hypothetical protein C2S52_015873 [Perilla frutescens var. hirtella]KAH6815338.1 hypothetical protein C2S51_020158 [Perilla frutescens var. frutescens]
MERRRKRSVEMSLSDCQITKVASRSIEGRLVEFAGEDVAGGQHMLHNRFSELASSDDDLDVMYTAMAFLVYILGCTLFTDKTGDRISCNYLLLFEDPDKFKGYAWGIVALAFLYRQLGVASRVGVKQIAGFLTLLEDFSTLGRPQQNAEYRVGQPFAMKWAQQAHGAVSENMVKAYKAQLVTLRVVWDLYVRL